MAEAGLEVIGHHSVMITTIPDSHRRACEQKSISLLLIPLGYRGAGRQLNLRGVFLERLHQERLTPLRKLAETLYRLIEILVGC